MTQARGSGLTLYEIARKMERRRELADRMAAYLDRDLTQCHAFTLDTGRTNDATTYFRNAGGCIVSRKIIEGKEASSRSQSPQPTPPTTVGASYLTAMTTPTSPIRTT